MNPTLPPRLGRIAALAILVLFLAFGYLVLARPLLAGHAEREAEIAALAERLARLEAMAGMEADAERLVEEARATSGGLFLSGDRPALVAADLQARLKAIAASHKVAIRSSRLLAPKTEEGLAYQGLSLDLRADEAALARFIHAVESATPLLFIDTAQVRAARAAMADPTSAPTLDARLEIRGVAAPRGAGS